MDVDETSLFRISAKTIEGQNIAVAISTRMVHYANGDEAVLYVKF